MSEPKFINVPNEIRLQVFQRDNYICRYCGKHVDKPDCEHIIARKMGGSNEIENLATSCRACNIMKCRMTPDELTLYRLLRQLRKASALRLRGAKNAWWIFRDEEGAPRCKQVWIDGRYQEHARVRWGCEYCGVDWIYLFPISASMNDLEIALVELEDQGLAGNWQRTNWIDKSKIH